MSETMPDTTPPASLDGRQSTADWRLVEMSDGTEMRVRVTNPDKLRWDLTAPRKNWPKGTDAPFLWLTFVTWAALKRTGMTDLDWDSFQRECVEVTQLKSEDPEVDVIRPTQSTPTDALS